MFVCQWNNGPPESPYCILTPKQGLTALIVNDSQIEPPNPEAVYLLNISCKHRGRTCLHGTCLVWELMLSWSDTAGLS